MGHYSVNLHHKVFMKLLSWPEWAQEMWQCSWYLAFIPFIPSFFTYIKFFIILVIQDKSSSFSNVYNRVICIRLTNTIYLAEYTGHYFWKKDANYKNRNWRKERTEEWRKFESIVPRIADPDVQQKWEGGVNKKR